MSCNSFGGAHMDLLEEIHELKSRLRVEDADVLERAITYIQSLKNEVIRLEEYEWIYNELNK